MTLSWTPGKWKPSDLQTGPRQQRAGCFRLWLLLEAGNALHSAAAADDLRWTPGSWSHSQAPPGSPGSSPGRHSPAPGTCTQTTVLLILPGYKQLMKLNGFLSHLFAVFSDRHAQRVLAAGLSRAYHRQDLSQGHAGHLPQHQNTSHPRHAICNRAGLIEHHHTDLSKQQRQIKCNNITVL